MLSPHQPTARISISETAILEESRRHSSRLGKIYIDAGNVSWKHDDVERESRHASGQARRDAFVRLAALNASYAVTLVTSPMPAGASRFRAVMRSIGRAAATTATVSLILCGLVYAATPFHHDVGLSRPECFPTGTPAAAERVSLVKTITLFVAALTTIEAMRQQADRPARALLIHPIWRP